MEQNEPTAATDAIGIVQHRLTEGEAIEIPGLLPGTEYQIISARAVRHRPPWWRANARDLWIWAGIGAGALLIAEAIGVVIFGVVTSS